jgi:hypothetical protein
VSGRLLLFTIPWRELAVESPGRQTESRCDHDPNLLVANG